MGKVKLFLDTNVVLDYFSGRMGDGLAAKVVNAGQDPHFELCISFLTAVNVMYFAKKLAPSLTTDVLRKLFTILPQDLQQWDDAPEMGLSDFEDALQAACALRGGCWFVITRDHHFDKAPVIKMTPQEFLDSIRS